MEKKISIEDLKSGKVNWSEIEVMKEYMPYAEKLKYAMGVVSSCIEVNQYGYLDIDYLMLNILKSLYHAYLFTNVEIKDFSIDEYDILKQSNVDTTIWGRDDVDNMDDFDNIIDSVLRGEKQKNSIENVLANASKNTIELLVDIGNHVNSLLDKGDPNKMAKYLSKGVEMLAKKAPDFSKFDVQHYLENTKAQKETAVQKEEEVDSHDLN